MVYYVARKGSGEVVQGGFADKAAAQEWFDANVKPWWQRQYTIKSTKGTPRNVYI